jgi:hypothetical protein
VRYRVRCDPPCSRISSPRGGAPERASCKRCAESSDRKAWAAVDVESLGVFDDASNALLGFNLFSHTLARATIVRWHER